MAPSVLSEVPAPSQPFLLWCWGRSWHLSPVLCMTDGLGVFLLHSLYLLSAGVKDGSWTVLQLVEALG